jgi:hypothetical protein
MSISVVYFSQFKKVHCIPFSTCAIDRIEAAQGYWAINAVGTIKEADMI